MKPIIKWCGGKTQCLDYIREKLPKDFKHYYEPFLGGAAVLIGMAPTEKAKRLLLLTIKKESALEKYIKLQDVENILKKLINEPVYYHVGEDFYNGVSAVESEIMFLPTIEVIEGD